MGINAITLVLIIAMLSAKTGTATSELATTFGDSSRSFAANLYSNVIKEKKGENVIISPFSLQTAASLLYAGASGETAQQMISGLKLTSEDKNVVAATYKSILDQHKNSPIIKIANKLFISPKVEVLPSFLDIVTEKFNSEVESIDFENAANAANEMNSWVEKKTEGKIKNLVDPGSIDSFTIGFILNAVHFKGTWTQQFKQFKTKTEDFWINEVATAPVEMMSNEANYGISYINRIDSILLELPFENSNFSMVIVLPNSKTGLNQVESELLKNNFEDLKVNFRSVKVNLALPKFKAESSIELKEVFKEMGMSKMFVNAEFYNLSKEYMEISKILHKAYIEVNEEGAEASAASGFQATARSGPFPFIVNKPFMYYIKGAEGEIYFLGRYVTP